MPPRPRTLSLFTFIDAFGWELRQRNPFMEDVLTTCTPLDTIFGYSSTCDPTILTGLMPRDHRHFSFFYHNPVMSPFALCSWLRLAPRAVTRRGRVRRLMSRLIRRLYGYTGYFQIYNVPFEHIDRFDYSERRDLYEPGGINSGASSVFDHLRRARVAFWKSDWRAPEEDNLAALEGELQRGDIRFAYLYMAHMDAVLHQYGAASDEGSRKIEWYERQMRRVMEAAGQRYDEVRLFVFSDHGMTDTTDICPLMERVEALGLRFGEDYVAMYDSTMARFWFLKDGVRQEIVAALEREWRGHIMSDDELQRYGCDFDDRVYGELFFLMNPGVLLCPSFMGETPLAAMHGYTPEDKDSTAMFASNVAFDTPSALPPKRLDDLFGLMMREAGLDIPQTSPKLQP